MLEFVRNMRTNKSTNTSYRDMETGPLNCYLITFNNKGMIRYKVGLAQA